MIQHGPGHRWGQLWPWQPLAGEVGPWAGAVLGTVPSRAWGTHEGHAGLQQLPRLAGLGAHPTLPHIPQRAALISIFGLGLLRPRTAALCQLGIVPARDCAGSGLCQPANRSRCGPSARAPPEPGSPEQPHLGPLGLILALLTLSHTR